MREFTKTLKLYHFRDRKMISLSIRSSTRHVLTFYIDEPTFERILQEHRDPRGAEVGPYFVQKKRTYLRFTFNHAQGPQENLRVPLQAWENLIAELRHKQRQSGDLLITCAVD